MTKTRTYICPLSNCGREFVATERRGKMCPCGDVELRSERYTIEGERGFFYKYELSNPGSAEVIRAESKRQDQLPLKEKEESVSVQGVEEPESDLPRLLFRDPDLSMETWLLREREVKSEGQVITAHYRIIFKGAMYRGWLYCPACGQQLADNSMMTIIQGEQGHRCRKSGCKAEVDVIYTGFTAGALAG